MAKKTEIWKSITQKNQRYEQEKGYDKKDPLSCFLSAQNVHQFQQG